MKVQVMMFGQLEQLTGNKSVELDGVADTDQLKTLIGEQFPKIAGFKYLIALNQEIVHEKAVLKEGDELALLPPFAGG